MAKKKRKSDKGEHAEGAAQQSGRDDLYRELNAGSAAYEIVVEEPELSLHSFAPSRRFRFDGSGSDSGDLFVDAFMKFLDANDYLVLGEEPSREFARGFAHAVAVAALYMDSLNLETA